MPFRFIEPQVELIDEKNPFKKIELSARTCYKSEDKITDDSAKKMVRNLIGREHYAMLEHQTFVFAINPDCLEAQCDTEADVGGFLNDLRKNPYLHVTEELRWESAPAFSSSAYGYLILVSGNLRAINEADWVAWPLLRAIEKDFPELVYRMDIFDKYHYSKGSYECLFKEKYKGEVKALLIDLDVIDGELKEREIFAHKYVTLKFTTDRGVSHEIVRHRLASYGQESTRYVNYRQGISIALPAGFGSKAIEVQEEYQMAFEDANRHYCNLIEMGEKPQQARAVLPTATKTEIVVTANMAEWRHIIDLRYFGTTGAPHPDMQYVMTMAYEILSADPISSRVLPKNNG